ncbi:hypothetical protein DPX16_3489 [Anabarilius grahami]|uniref:Ubiquitin-like domain-containing protein n=1 Tax=Anabarilius grahami TaxID=495550 RepID=A0A3N0Y765_ANAGA|nr:hypothetical protein DPX16_3489 [Anabarilius grahami]
MIYQVLFNFTDSKNKVLEVADSLEEFNKTTIRELKEKFREKIPGVPDLDLLRVIFGRDPLEDHQTLEFYNIKHLSLLLFLMKIPGGGGGTDQYGFPYTISKSEEDQDQLAPTVHTAPAAKPPMDHTTKPTTNKEPKSLEDLKPEPSANPVIWRAKSDQLKPEEQSLNSLPVLYWTKRYSLNPFFALLWPRRPFLNSVLSCIGQGGSLQTILPFLLRPRRLSHNPLPMSSSSLAPSLLVPFSSSFAGSSLKLRSTLDFQFTSSTLVCRHPGSTSNRQAHNSTSALLPFPYPHGT